MSDKRLVVLGGVIGSAIGGYIPALWGASAFSGWGILGGLVGGLLGIWLAWRYLQS